MRGHSVSRCRGPLSTISAHGRALKLGSKPNIKDTRLPLSTISAHGRALKHSQYVLVGGDGDDFQQFRLTVEH